jgi:hypothetical protein
MNPVLHREIREIREGQSFHREVGEIRKGQFDSQRDQGDEGGPIHFTGRSGRSERVNSFHREIREIRGSIHFTGRSGRPVSSDRIL